MAPKLPSILLVDDEKDFLDIFSTKLSSSGFEIIRASSGAEALERLKEFKPDLILLDVNMPEINGTEVLSQIKSNPENANLKIVFLTSLGEPLPAKELLKNDQKFAQESGAIDYIQKSDDLDNIVKKVKEILTRNKI